MDELEDILQYAGLKYLFQNCASLLSFNKFMRCFQFDKHLTKTIILLWEKKLFHTNFRLPLKPKADPPASIPGVYQSSRPSCAIRSGHQPAQTLPDGAFHTCPYWALESLCSPYVVPVQAGVGDLVLGLRVRSCPVIRTRHQHRQRASLWLKLHHVELLLVGQRLVGFLQGGRRDALLRLQIYTLTEFSQTV